MGVCSAVASPASAITITILNPSFETPGLPATPVGDSFTNNSIPNWVGSGSPVFSFGVFNPSAGAPGSYYSVPVPNGNQVAYLNVGNISQTLSATLTANTIYSLSVSVGDRLDTAFPGYNVELLAGTTVLAFNSSVTVPNGQFAQVIVPYTSPTSSPLIGQALAVRLSTSGLQTNFDNVTLSATPVPLETDALPVVGAAAFMAGGLWWKKKRAGAKALDLSPTEPVKG